VIAVPDKDRIEQMVRRVVHRTLGLGGGIRRTPSRPMVTERDINAVPFRGEFVVPPGALVTPLARQIALDRKVTLIEGGATQSPSALTVQTPTVTSPGSQSVAIGADHGGYELKEVIKVHLAELGFTVVDCGTDSTQSVDYPDYAFVVAQLVGRGQAWMGIVIDGAGIGSCMVANKVPGVRASMCYDQATAMNSREHNNANVLCLGAGLIGVNLARQIVQIWLKTSFAGGRHARRVDKIKEIEQRFAR
jgi:ribose 5-phosphate isomerase B